MTKVRLKHRRGSSLIWTTVTLTVLAGFCSLGVDWGRVQLVKTELRRTADAAVRYAAPAMAQGIDAVRARAKDVADDNLADGKPVILADSDIEHGHWVSGTRTFVPNGIPADAVRVTARRSGADAVPLMFARILGRHSVNVSASAGFLTSQSPGFTGLNGIQFKNNTFVGSYDSGVVIKPVKGVSTGHGALASNGVIEGQNRVELDGNATIGPAGSVSGIDVDGSTTKQSTPIVAPTSPAWSADPNPLGLPSSYTVNSSTVLPGGTYKFTSLTLNADLSFSGKAVVHVNGNISAGRVTITAYDGRPSNLKIHQLGEGRTFIANNDLTMTAAVMAPGSDFTAKNKLTFYGTAVFRSIEAMNNTEIFLDQSAVTEVAGGLVQ